jgi:hypothetical protein
MVGESSVTSLLDDLASGSAVAADTEATTGCDREHWYESHDQNGCRRGTECMKGGVISILLRRDGSSGRRRKPGKSARWVEADYRKGKTEMSSLSMS